MYKYILAALTTLFTIHASLAIAAVEQFEPAQFQNEEAAPPRNYSYMPTETVMVTPEMVTPEEGVDVSHAPLTFIVDKTFSAVVGADLFISALHTYQLLDDTFIPNTYGATNFGMVLGRIGKFALEDVLFSTGMVAQHEIFGHGARAREFNVHVTKYKVLPYSGYTVFSSKDCHNLSLTERIAITTGGVEGTYILAKQLRNRWLETKFLDEREAHFYLLNAFDQTQYVLGTKKHERNRRRHSTFVNDGHDILHYIREINNLYGKRVLTTSKLRRRILFDFADPYGWYSVFSLGSYFYEGAQGFEYPMIPIGGVHYLPGFRIALAPYGPEYQFINYIRGLDHTLQVTFRYGNTDSIQSYALTLDLTRLITSDLFSIDGRLDLWNQPKFHTFRMCREDNKYGAALSLLGRYKIGPCLEIMGQIGYKTTGYIPGEFLRRTPIIRAGFALNL